MDICVDIPFHRLHFLNNYLNISVLICLALYMYFRNIHTQINISLTLTHTRAHKRINIEGMKVSEEPLLLPLVQSA